MQQEGNIPSGHAGMPAVEWFCHLAFPRNPDGERVALQACPRSSTPLCAQLQTTLTSPLSEPAPTHGQKAPHLLPILPPDTRLPFRQAARLYSPPFSCAAWLRETLHPHAHTPCPPCRSRVSTSRQAMPLAKGASVRACMHACAARFNSLLRATHHAAHLLVICAHRGPLLKGMPAVPLPLFLAASLHVRGSVQPFPAAAVSRMQVLMQGGFVQVF